MSNPDIERLLAIMEKLRDPQQGCPWDKEQTFTSIIPFTLEEAYEVADAIEREDWAELPAELGDLLFQIVFYSQLGKEQQQFDFSTVVSRICDKLVQRHPHVFADADIKDLHDNWEKLKAGERQARQLNSILDDIPNALPALTRAAKIQKRVARVGFDWGELSPVVDKVREELDEVIVEAQTSPQIPQKVQEEVGDLLFAAVNLARHLGVNPEEALRQANHKFERRFRGVEQRVHESGKAFEEHSLMSLDQYWEQVKQQERS
ncbi:nucleoside triphosphate pyrophosphohydrolase [Shewanella yunxiaonensis]|uniref:Nucleoside triphosphate pyrophosphohydrolase n=1 Tax=Shewanella yunxiaonensis TaxID=2829809 RepID=A0ABX7YRN2_9GAMM|nr:MULTISPECIES: nucleoside triphosphate pyrophosphohydrolase [Shewanella]MDF0534541.1 nucleoside triphosphate pyrophosphohydrolase [Shewanella sp. A32]QUN04836.1 nucleoside triphosphate pyrophosphohydrolase [Shewanella yunxiaonensis]